MTGDALLLWVDDLDDDSIAVAGSKIARLGHLRKAGVSVPDGFVVTTAVYERFCAESGLDGAIAEAVGRVVDVDDFEQIERASHDIRLAFERAPMSDELTEVLADTYEELCYRCYDLNVPVAVRSSATGEDAADASFAGQFDTYLGMSGPQRVLDAVRRCWGSLFTGRALHYRLTHGLSHHDSPMAVGVIRLVHARCSGVAFSIHPVTGKTDRMVVEGSFGWGEAVVQGLVTPDHIEVGKSDRRLLRHDVAHKTVVSAFDYALGQVVEHEMPKRLVDAPILDEEQIAAVVDSVLRIEDLYGYPVDVEWVIDRDRRPGEPVSIVQTRPETVHSVDGAAPPPSTPRWDPVAYAAKYAFGGKR